MKGQRRLPAGEYPAASAEMVSQAPLRPQTSSRATRRPAKAEATQSRAIFRSHNSSIEGLAKTARRCRKYHLSKRIPGSNLPQTVVAGDEPITFVRNCSESGVRGHLARDEMHYRAMPGHYSAPSTPLEQDISPPMHSQTVSQKRIGVMESAVVCQSVVSPIATSGKCSQHVTIVFLSRFTDSDSGGSQDLS
jgi:hypothetical protein